MTALSGLAVYLEMAEAMGLGEAIGRLVKVKERGQGWTDLQMVTALVLLNLAGGEGVDDLRLLEADEGLGRMLGRVETHRQGAFERRAEGRRGGAAGAAACRLRRRCSGIWAGFTTQRRRRLGSRTKRSYPPPTAR